MTNMLSAWMMVILLSLGKLFTNKGEPIKGKMLAKRRSALMDFAMEKSAKIVEDIKKKYTAALLLMNMVPVLVITVIMSVYVGVMDYTN